MGYGSIIFASAFLSVPMEVVTELIGLLKLLGLLNNVFLFCDPVSSIWRVGGLRRVLGRAIHLLMRVGKLRSDTFVRRQCIGIREP